MKKWIHPAFFVCLFNYMYHTLCEMKKISNYNLIEVNEKFSSTIRNRIYKNDFNQYQSIYDPFISSIFSHNSIMYLPATEITATWDNIFSFVKISVNLTDNNLDLRITLNKSINTFGRTDQV